MATEETQRRISGIPERANSPRVDTANRLVHFNEQRVRDILSGEVVQEIIDGRKLVVVFGSNGNNAERFSKGWKEQGLLIAAVGRKKIPMVGEIAIAPSLQFDSTDTEDSQRLDTLLASGVVSSVYDSTPPHVHIRNLKAVLPHLQSGAVPKYITTKPVGGSLSEYLEIKRLLGAHGDKPGGINGELVNKFFIHEHYLAKGAWVAVRSHLNEAIGELGRLTKFTVSIQEEQTIEEQGRQKTLNDGILQDLSPHAASLGLDVYRIINSGDRYRISNHSKPINDDTPVLSTVHYLPSDLSEDRDTGFIIKAKTTITDNQEPEGANQHDLVYEWDAGKGLVNKKEVRMEFVHSDTHETSQLVINLQNNKIDAPESVSHLFSETSADNGYGGITASPLNGADPNLIFQRWPEAFIVGKWEKLFRNRNQNIKPKVYPVSERHPIEKLLAA